MIHRLFSILLIIVTSFSSISSIKFQSLDSEWSQPIDITGGATDNWRSFGSLVCDPYQNLHVFWADHSDTGAAIYYRNDINGTWSYPNDVLSIRENNVFNLKTAVSPQTDTIHLTWATYIFDAILYYSNSPLSEADSAKSWLPPAVIATGVSNSDIAVESDGKIHLVYSVSFQNGTDNAVYHIVSTTNGTSWSDPELIYSRTTSQPSTIQVWLDIDGKGRIHVGLTLRSREYGVFSELGYIRTMEDGTTWSNYLLIDDIGTAWQGVAWIEPYSFGEDEIHLTWHDPRRMHQWSMDGGQTWSQPVEIMPLGAAFGGPNEIAKDSAGNLHIVMAISNGVFTAEWKDQQWSPPEQIDSRDIDPHSQNLVTCQGNRLHVVYWDRTGDETVWYSTRKLNTPIIERQPIPQPSTDSIDQTISQAPITSKAIPTATINSIRETLIADPMSTTDDHNFVMSKMFYGVIPSAILIVGVILIALLKLRR